MTTLSTLMKSKLLFIINKDWRNQFEFSIVVNCKFKCFVNIIDFLWRRESGYNQLREGGITS
jgi:hypothetical protein